MSGVLDDGVLGLGAIRSRGATTIGQSLDDALFPELPAKARDAGVLDRQAAAAEIGEVLKQLSQREVKEPELQPDAQMELANRIAMTRRFSTNFDTQQLGAASGYTCPDCNGSLVSIDAGHFRCRVGTPGHPTHCWPPATTKSGARCGSPYAACRKRQNWQGNWPTASVTALSFGGTTSWPRKPKPR